MSGIGNTESDPAFDRQMAKLHEENATHNAQVALKVAEMSKQEMTDAIIRQDAAINTLIQNMALLEQRVNLMLTKHFNNGPTEG